MALTEVDRRLLSRCLDQAPGAWRDFVDRFIGLVIHVIKHSAEARSVKLSSADVDDLCSDVFVALLSRDFAVLRNFRGRSSLATYLTVVARRIVIKQLVERKKAELLEQNHSRHSGSHASSGEAPFEMERIENRDLVQSLLNRLPVEEAEVVRRFHLEGRTYVQISEDLGIPVNSIGPLLTRAREQMRKQPLTAAAH